MMVDYLNNKNKNNKYINKNNHIINIIIISFNFIKNDKFSL